MKKNLLLLSLVCSTALYSQTIKSIDLKNLTTISPDVANETLDMKVSDELNFDKLNKALKKFYTFGYFDDIKFYNENGNITLEFTEKPSVVAVEIEGYKQREEELAAIRKAMKLDKGSLYTKAKIENAKQVLLDLLESEGYINSVVEAEIEEVNERSLKVTFSVNKGETIVITDAKYYGANELEQDDFDTVSANKPKEFASWFFGQNDGEVKIDQLQYDARRINELYFEKGFLDAKVKEPYLNIDFASNEANLEYFIEEGKTYTTNDIKIYVDASIIDTEILYEELSLKTDRTFNIKKLRKDQEMIKTAIADKGYAFANVKFDIQKNSEDGKVNVVFSAIPGEKVYINDVKISGNFRTLDRVIRRNVYLAPGDLFSLTDFNDSKSKLKRSGFFDDVIIEQKRVSADKVDISVKVVEAATGSLMIGGGYGSYDGVMVNGSISDKNVFGSGLGLSFSADLSKSQSNYSLSLSNPSIGDSDYNGSVEIHRSDREISKTQYDSNINMTGFSVSAGKEVVRDLYAGLKYRFDAVEEEYTYITGTTVAADDQFIPTDYLTSSITPYLNYNNTDDYFLPREGIKFNASAEIAGLGGDSRYIKSNNTFKYYNNLNDAFELDWIFRYKAQISVLGDLGQINQGDSLYLGGPKTLRGFESYAFPTSEDGAKFAPYRFMTSNSVEMNFPLVPSAKMRWSMFYDYGTIGEDGFTDIQRSSVGAVLEWISPFGPLQLIFSNPLDDEEGDATSSFEFQLGAGF